MGVQPNRYHELGHTMAMIPVPMVMIGFFLIALVSVSAAYEPSASLMLPYEELAREGSVLLPAAAPGGCSVSLPKLGLPVSNSTTKSSSLAKKCASPTTKKAGASSITKAVVKTSSTPAVAAPKTSLQHQDAEQGLREAWAAGPALSGPRLDARLAALRVHLNSRDPLQEEEEEEEEEDWKESSNDDLEPSLDTLRDDVEQACAHHVEHDKKVVCMVHEVLRMRGQVEPLTVEKDGHKVQVVSMLQQDQVVFEDEM